MTRQKRPYLSYLLRLWAVGPEDTPSWRASLESTRSGERLGFASLDDLCHFLREQITSLPNRKGPGEAFETLPKPDDNGQKREEGGVDDPDLFEADDDGG